MTDSSLKAYFDSIADEWDGWMDMPRIDSRLDEGLELFGVGGEERVLDAGCGTGNLTRRLLRRLNDAGRVIAVDVSPEMIRLAREKNPDSRARFRVEDLRHLSAGDGELDRVICFSMWPHVAEPERALEEIYRVLKPGGRLHVWHIDSRQTINHVHANAGEAVRGDMLIPAKELAAMVAGAGFAVHEIVDTDTEYRVSAEKRAE